MQQLIGPFFQACLEKGFAPFSHESLRPEGLERMDSDMEDVGKKGPGLAFPSASGRP